MMSSADVDLLNVAIICEAFSIPPPYWNFFMAQTEKAKTYKFYWEKNFKEVGMVYVIEWCNVYIHSSKNNSAQVLDNYWFGFVTRGVTYPSTSSMTDPYFNIFGIKGWNAQTATFDMLTDDGIFMDSVRIMNQVAESARIICAKATTILFQHGSQGKRFAFQNSRNLLLDYSLEDVST